MEVLVPSDVKQSSMDRDIMGKQMKQTKRIAVVGFGNVGKGVIEILLKHKIPQLELRKIVVKDKNKERPFSVAPELLSTDIQEVVQDEDIDVVVEVMGDVEEARKLIIGALKNGKDVVTANKALISGHGPEIFSLANERGRHIGFRGTFVGCHILIHDVFLSARTIKKVHAILNGTCNFVLSNMARKNASFEQSLSEAQTKGYAEADPWDDISGSDTAQKIKILLGVLNNTTRTDFSVPYEGIENISIQDIHFAQDLGFAIKLLGIIQRVDSGFIVAVHPALVPLRSTLGYVEDQNNAIEIENEFGMTSGLVALGAGTYPTANAIINDLQDIVYQANFFMPRFDIPVKTYTTDECQRRFYLRLTVIDKPGVLAQITGVLGEHNISLSSVIQKGPQSPEYTYVVMATHTTRERQLRLAVNDIDKLDEVKGKTNLIPILE